MSTSGHDNYSQERMCLLFPIRHEEEAWWRCAVSNDLLGKDRHTAAKGGYILLWERHKVIVVVLNILLKRAFIYEREDILQEVDIPLGQIYIVGCVDILLGGDYATGLDIYG